MLGDTVVTAKKEKKNYKIKILEDQKLEEDPNYPCIDYDVIGEYSQCLEEEILRQNSYFINCTPPWMTNNQDLWCKGELYFDSKFLKRKYIYFLQIIGISNADHGKCLGILSKR